MSKKESAKQLDYILGQSQKEVQRLIYQAAMLRPITERLFRSVKLESGMRVLDLGCGAGDVSMLVAELVGPKGSVVGIDQNRDVLTLAAQRARAAELRQITFENVSIESFSTRANAAPKGRILTLDISPQKTFLSLHVHAQETSCPRAFSSENSTKATGGSTNARAAVRSGLQPTS